MVNPFALVVGFAGGFILGLIRPEQAAFLGILGDIFLRLLKLVVPLIMFGSIVMAVEGMQDTKRLGRMGGRALVYYLGTNVLSVSVGLILVNLVQPGRALRGAFEGGGDFGRMSFAEFMTKLVPDNPIRPFVEGEMMGILFFSLLFGVALLALGPKGDPLRALTRAIYDFSLLAVGWVLKLTPIGIFGLAVAVAAKFGLGSLKGLAAYVGTVLGGLAIHALIILPILLGLIGRLNPLRFARQFGTALLTAFSTSSSSATLPVTLRCAEGAGVTERTRQFILPLGATLNMDGTALYEGVAAVFIAQAYGIPLGIGDQVLIFLTANLAAVGAAGIPSAGLITMTLVLQAVGLPLEGIGMILAVDRFLDMFRTTVNVWGDAVGCGVLDRWSSKTVGMIGNRRS